MITIQFCEEMLVFSLKSFNNVLKKASTFLKEKSRGVD